MSRRHSHKHPELLLGPLPVAVINRTIGTYLDEGEVVLTPRKHDHVIQEHPADYATCLPHIAAVISNPLYVGDDHRNPGFEVIGRVSVVNSFVLVAVEIEPDKNGRYRIATFYRISEKKIQSRRERGFVRVAIKV